MITIWHIAFSTFMRTLRSRSELIVSIGFIISFSAVAALGIGPEAFQQAEIGVGLLWLSLLLALALATPNFVSREEEQGTLIQWQLLPASFGAILFARAAGLFAGTILPLILCIPFIGIAYGLESATLVQTAAFLLLGGWGYWLICTSASILLLGSTRAAGLQLLLTLPLGAPLLIFGCAASLREGAALDNATLLLSAAALALSAISPWLMGILLRMYRTA